MILKDLFANLAILISILFLYTIFSKPLHLKSPVKKKIAAGIFGGGLCNILMHYSIYIGPSYIVDLRHIPIILLAYFGGALPALVAVILIIAGRLIIGINSSAFASIIFIIFSTLFSLFISKSHFSRKIKIFFTLTFTNLLFSMMTYFLIHDKNLLELLILYWAISYLAGYIAFYTIRYLRDREQLFNKYRFESTIDGLTGLNNVRKFDEVYNNLVKDLKTMIQSLTLFYIDIDFFKQINDTYGHSEGDVILKELAFILKSCTRSFDTVSRNGGEEFTVLLPDCQLSKAIEIAEGIRKTVEDYNFTLNNGQVIKLTVSIGISSYQDTTDNPSMLIDDADKALYHAKNSGRNRVYYAVQENETRNTQYR